MSSCAQGSGRMFRSGLPRRYDKSVDRSSHREDRLARAGGIETGGGFSFSSRLCTGAAQVAGGAVGGFVQGRQIVTGTERLT